MIIRLCDRMAPRMRVGVLAGLAALLLASCETGGTGPVGGGTAADAQGRVRSMQEPFQDCDECPFMVAVPAGSFMMGSPSSEGGRSSDEGPQHQVQIGAAFAVSQYEVTFDEWDACVKGGGCNGYGSGDAGWGRGRRPVIYVSWKHAQAYVAWLSKVTGDTYRLPSEAEWEYAARAGTTTRSSWANFHGHVGKTTEVGSYPANPWGLYDMHGNVWEWVEDCWNAGYYGAPTDGSAWTGGDCSRRVMRGGSWNNWLPSDLRSANSPLTKSVGREIRVR